MSVAEPDKIYESIRQIQNSLDQMNLEIFGNMEQIAKHLRDINELKAKNRDLRAKASYASGSIQGLSDARWLR